jgi:hypothetical protein
MVGSTYQTTLQGSHETTKTEARHVSHYFRLFQAKRLGSIVQRPVAAAIGLAADAGLFWSDLSVGELKTELAKARPHWA